MKHIENLEFYGKKVREFNEKEIELLMNDLLIVTSIHLMYKGEVIREVVNGEIIEIGTPESFDKRVNERSIILRKLMNMETEPDIVLFFVSETSGYSFYGFMERMEHYKNEGIDVTNNNVTKVLGMEVHIN